MWAAPTSGIQGTAFAKDGPAAAILADGSVPLWDRRAETAFRIADALVLGSLHTGNDSTSSPVLTTYSSIERDHEGQASRRVPAVDSEGRSTKIIFLVLVLMLGGMVKYFVSPGFYDLLSDVCSTLYAIEHEGRDIRE